MTKDPNLKEVAILTQTTMFPMFLSLQSPHCIPKHDLSPKPSQTLTIAN